MTVNLGAEPSKNPLAGVDRSASSKRWIGNLREKSKTRIDKRLGRGVESFLATRSLKTISSGNHNECESRARRGNPSGAEPWRV